MADINKIINIHKKNLFYLAGLLSLKFIFEILK